MIAGKTPKGLRRLLADTTPLQVSPAFAKLWISNSVAQIGAQMTIVAVGLHVYALTGSTLAVAFVALWALGPMIVAGLVGGTIADIFDRRTVAIMTALVAWISIGTMTLIAFLDVTATWPYYALAAVNAASATILGTARGAIIPRLLPLQLLPAAAALGGITMGLAVTVGPAIAGVLVATVGVPWTFLLDTALFTVGFMGLVSLPSVPPIIEYGDAHGQMTGRRPNPIRVTIDSIRVSLQFLREAPNVRATFVFDLLAMTLGQPRVVFPAAGALVLGGGAITVGFLTAAYAFGALLSSLLSGPLGGVRKQGRAVMVAIAAYGASTGLFGLVLLVSSLFRGLPAFAPLPTNIEDYAVSISVPAVLVASLALAAAGAADNVSSVFRSTILQAASPDDVRGRMQGIFYVVVAGGPRVGDLLAGFLATVIAVWAPSVFGAIVIVVVVLLSLRAAHGFQHYDSQYPKP